MLCAGLLPVSCPALLRTCDHVECLLMPGRKPLPIERVRNIRFTINLCLLQRQFVDTNGGAAWVVALIQKEIDKAIEEANKSFPNVDNDGNDGTISEDR